MQQYESTGLECTFIKKIRRTARYCFWLANNSPITAGCLFGMNQLWHFDYESNLLYFLTRLFLSISSKKIYEQS